MSRFGPALAIAAAARRERWNLLWRFSRFKAGAWLLLSQAGAIAAALYNFARSGFSLPFASALSLIAVQSAVWGFASAFTQERDRLYRGRIVELVHLSPAPAHSLPLAGILSDLPSRAWTSLIWAGMFSRTSTGGWWNLPVLWMTSLAVSVATQLFATRLLVAAVRRRPNFLVWLWTLTLAGVAVLTGLFAYALVQPELLGRAGAYLVPVAPPLAALIVAAGAAAGAAALLRPERLGELYRESWLRFSECSRTASLRVRSRWPALVRGQAGSLQAKDWLMALRNPLTWIRLGALAAVVAAMALLRPWLSSFSLEARRAAAEAVPYGAILFILGEAVAASLPAEREKLALFAVAGSTAGRLLFGKALAAAPVVLLTAVCYALSGWLFALEPDLAGRLLEGALSGTGMVALLLGAGALEAPRRHPGLPIDEGHQQMFEQIPTGIFSQAGFLAAAAFGAARVWGPPLAGALAWIAPLVAFAAGWLRLERFFRAGRKQ